MKARQAAVHDPPNSKFEISIPPHNGVFLAYSSMGGDPVNH